MPNMRDDKERRFKLLKKQLIAAARGPKIEVAVSEIQKKGLIAALKLTSGKK